MDKYVAMLNEAKNLPSHKAKTKLIFDHNSCELSLQEFL